MELLILLTIPLVFAAGFSIGFAAAARRAAKEHRQQAAEFDELTRQVRDLQARTQEHLPD